MPFDPQDGFPDDWTRPAPAPLDDGYPDDWFVPPSAQGPGFPDDWVGPVYDAPSAPPAAPGPQPGTTAWRGPTPPASDSFAAFLPFMPATRAAMGAWGQPLTGGGLGQSALQPLWPPALAPFSGGGLFGSPASSQFATDAPPFTSSSLFGDVTTPKPESSDASLYSMLFGGVTAPKAESSDPLWDNSLFGAAVAPNPATGNAPSSTLAADGTFTTTLPPASGNNIDRPPVSSRLLVAASEGGDREDEERRKLETPEVIGGLREPGLWSPKQPPTLPSIPPLEVSPETAEGAAGTGGWELLPIQRGREHEQIFGHNLHPNNPTVDRWEVDSGAVISIKSVNLNSPTYRDEGRNALYNKLSRDLNDLAEFRGSDYGDTLISEDAIKSRKLWIIVPNAGTAAQQEAIRRIVELGRKRGMTVDVIIYP